MPQYHPPLRDMQFVLHEVLNVTDTLKDLPRHRDVDVVVPMPLHPVRHAERGFNQSAELGRWVAREVGRGFCEGAVTRVRHTGPQVGLRLDERRTNLAGAFSCAASLAGLRVAVVDDVLTTGSTARAIATALREVGAASVDFGPLS